MPPYTRQRRITPYAITATNPLSPECLLPTLIFAEWVDRGLSEWTPGIDTRHPRTLKFFERVRQLPPANGIEVIPDLKLKYAVQKVLDDNSITNRNELDHWVKLNGGTRTAPNGFYKKVKDISQTHWSKLKVPEMSCTAAYEKILPGYKQCV